MAKTYVQTSPKGPATLGKFLFILWNNLPPVPWDKCARWFLDLPNFVKAYQTSKTLLTCLGADHFFVRHEIWQICQFTCHDLKENVNKKNWSLFLDELFQPEARENYLYLRSNKMVKMEEQRRTRRSLRWHIKSSNCLCCSYPNSRAKKTRLLRSHVNFLTNSIKVIVLISVWLTLMVNNDFAVSQWAHTWQKLNLAETNFVEIFGRAKLMCQSSVSGP